MLDVNNTVVDPILYKDLFEISSTGIFNVLNFTRVYHYKVFIAPYNTEIWADFSSSLATHLIDIRFYDSDFDQPNMKP